MLEKGNMFARAVTSSEEVTAASSHSIKAKMNVRQALRLGCSLEGDNRNTIIAYVLAILTIEKY